MKRPLIFTIILFSVAFTTFSQNDLVPASYSNISYDEEGKLFFEKEGNRYYAKDDISLFSLEQLMGDPLPTETGVELNFKGLEGTITYGLIPYGKAPHPLPVYRLTKQLIHGKVDIDISNDFKYPYDFVDWEENQQLTIGYRLTAPDGLIIYDGEISLVGKGPFKIAPTLYEGPFVNKVTEESAVIWFNTSLPVKAAVEVNGNRYEDESESTYHEIEISNLDPDQTYSYTVKYGEMSQEYQFKTAPQKGSRKPFVFGYTSDSRHATGGGERMVYGANAYIMKKMAALAYQQDAAFVQFTGDMINGYLNNNEDQNLQYTNWKKSIEPFWHYIPFYIGMGNHEALGHVFIDEEGKSQAFIDGFPYDSNSAEAVFAENFVNFENGPGSEDSSKYDPSKNKDFPDYNENVFYYTYGNIAMVVLNSDYWYAPSLYKETSTGGGLHGYIMDNQLEWLRKTIGELDRDPEIDHIFVTQHTPAFPNGGHSKDDMWYS